jgi:hypothetical protein
MTYLDKDWQLRFIYNTTPTGFPIMEHVERHWINVTGGVDPGGDLSDFEITQRNGVPGNADVSVDAMVAALISRHSTVSEINRAELWAASVGSDDFIFYSTYTIAEIGTVASSAQVALQETYTFRSADGKTGRIQIMEGVTAGNGRNSYPFGGTAQTLADYFSGSTSPFITRSRAPFVSPINLLFGQNEQLFEKRFRS